MNRGGRVEKEAPDQNRTDTNSLEGYGSTIELQARGICSPNIHEGRILPQGYFMEKTN